MTMNEDAEDGDEGNMRRRREALMSATSVHARRTDIYNVLQQYDGYLSSCMT